MTEETTQQAQDMIETVSSEINELINVSRGALVIPDITQKTVQRNLNELCTGIIEKVCGLVSKEEATSILCEQISAVQNMTGKQLSDFLTQRFKMIEEANGDGLERSVSNVLSEIDLDRDELGDFGDATNIENVDEENKQQAQRKRFSLAEKM